MSNMKVKLLRLCIPVAIIVAVAVCSIKYLVPYISYSSANKYYQSGEYDKALEVYHKLGEYKDCTERVVETLYHKGIAQMDEGEYVGAADTFDTICGYKDSKTLADSCRNEAKYLLGKEKLDSGEPKEALELFAELGDYLDSEELVIRSKYCIADKLLQSGEYQKAGAAFSASDIKDYENSSEKCKEAYYLYAMECMDKQDYLEASNAFRMSILVTYRDAGEKYKEACFAYAVQCFDREDYSNVMRVLSNIMGYEGVEELWTETRYRQATMLLETGKYKDAINQFSELKDYKDSKIRCNEAKYQYAGTNVEEDYDNAIRYLEFLAGIDYRDSKELLEEMSKWRIVITAVNNDPDSRENMTALNKYDKWYVHFTLMGGKAMGSTWLRIRIEYPNGDITEVYSAVEYSCKMQGWIWCQYSDLKKAEPGIVVVTFYDENDNEIGECVLHIK